MLLHYDVQEKRVQTHGCKRVYGMRSFAYRMPHPHPAAACRLRLPRIWNPSLRRLPLAVSSSKLAQLTCLLYGKRSCGFADSSTSGTVARTTCTLGAAPGVWSCVGSRSGAL